MVGFLTSLSSCIRYQGCMEAFYRSRQSAACFMLRSADPMRVLEGTYWVSAGSIVNAEQKLGGETSPKGVSIKSNVTYNVVAPSGAMAPGWSCYRTGVVHC